MLDWYRQHYPELMEKDRARVDQAVRGIQEAYMENVYPQMNIEWGAYRNFIGHEDGSGCFRCHNDSLLAENGKTISAECETCHIVLGEEGVPRDLVGALKGLSR